VQRSVAFAVLSLRGLITPCMMRLIVRNITRNNVTNAPNVGMMLLENMSASLEGYFTMIALIGNLFRILKIKDGKKIIFIDHP